MLDAAVLLVDRLFSAGLLRSRQVERFVDQVDHAVAVRGGNDVRVAQAEFVEFGGDRRCTSCPRTC